MADLLQVTGCKTPYSLALALDPESVWMDSIKSGHLSKWYSFDRGRIPRRALVTRVASKARNASFDVLHPVWQYLRNPKLSARSVRRLRACMEKRWRGSFDRALVMGAEQLRFCPSLIEKIGLSSMSFLDASMLFALVRDERLHQRNDPELEAAFASLLLMLPILYACEGLWGITRSDGAGDGSTRLLGILDRSLLLNNGRCGEPCFPVAERAEAIGWLRWQMDLHRQLHPRSLRSLASCIRFTLRFLGAGSGDTVRFAFSPYIPGGCLTRDEAVGKPVGEPAWIWAWHNISLGRYPTQMDCADAERIWQVWQRKKANP